MKVAGWVNRRRDHGGLVFIDIRDRTGILQLVFDPEHHPEAHEAAHGIRNEYVISTMGVVRARGEDQVNPAIATGRVELPVDDLAVLAQAKTPPFYPEDDLDVDETLRLKYRYLDLRRPTMQRNLMLRDKVVQGTRRHLETQGFVEVETPMLTKSTPEGARDFLVPSRLRPGEFYALPQSPQLFKQLLMVAGFERYYQIARSFRDEDLRADRQPEFTQIDLEMSFVDEQDIQDLVEGVMGRVFKETLAVDLSRPFPRLSFAEAMRRYGTDKPDVRFGMEIIDASDVVEGVAFKVFADALAQGGAVRGLRVEGGGGFSRKDVDDLGKEAAVYGAKGLAPVWVEETGVRSPIAKFLSEVEMAALVSRLAGRPGDLLLVRSRSPFRGGVDSWGAPLEPGRSCGREAGGLGFPVDSRSPDVRVRRARAPSQSPASPLHDAQTVRRRRPRRQPSIAGHVCLRLGAQRGRTRQWVDPHRRPGDPGGCVPSAGARRRRDTCQVRFLGRGFGLRSPASWRHRAGPRPAVDVDGRGIVDPRRHRLPEDSEWFVSAHGCSVSRRRRATARAAAADPMRSNQ